MYQLVLLIHIFVAICIIALVLVQQGKGATMGAAFGSGASSTVFGSRGSGSFLFRVTIGFVGVFFITSIAMNYMASSTMRQEKTVTVPAMPLQKAPARVNPAAQIPVKSTPVSTTQPVTPVSPSPNQIPAR